MTTVSPTHGVWVKAATPPAANTRTICSVAYATEEIGSLQNTGKASQVGSNVSPSRALRIGRPTSNLFNSRLTPPSLASRQPAGTDLDAFLTDPPCPGTLNLPNSTRVLSRLRAIALLLSSGDAELLRFTNLS